ncbi:MAG: hypothetical protein ACD_72C00404G0004 [uncultured bacterium]|nr:MAG: hypothetical protein ACD_72C00404G0004 [uncultured bacterium]
MHRERVSLSHRVLRHPFKEVSMWRKILIRSAKAFVAKLLIIGAILMFFPMPTMRGIMWAAGYPLIFDVLPILNTIALKRFGRGRFTDPAKEEAFLIKCAQNGYLLEILCIAVSVLSCLTH